MDKRYKLLPYELVEKIDVMVDALIWNDNKLSPHPMCPLLRGETYILDEVVPDVVRVAYLLAIAKMS
jgi:hypothetical protein